MQIDCKGTKHFHDSRKANYKGYYECDGNGWLILDTFETQRKISDNSNEQAIRTLKAWGLNCSESDLQENVHDPRPSMVAMCPCREQEATDLRNKYVMEALGMKKAFALREHQLLAKTKFGEKGNLFVHGASRLGKTVLLNSIGCSSNAEKLKVVVGVQMKDIMIENAMERNVAQKLKWKGLVIWDDADKAFIQTSSGFMQECIWALIDRVDKGKMNMVISSNLSPLFFAKKACNNEDVLVNTMKKRICANFAIYEIVDLEKNKEKKMF